METIMADDTEKTYVYCHDCNKLLFVARSQEAAVMFSTNLALHKQVDHYNHKHTTGKLWYFKKWMPEVNVEGWDNYGETS